MRQPEFDAHIIAGGNGSRMRPVKETLGMPEDFPKHLFPTGGPSGETLVGRIVNQAAAAPEIGRLTLHASKASEEYFRGFFKTDSWVNIRTDAPLGNFGPIVMAHQEGNRFVAAAGDSYSSEHWSAILDFHTSHHFPVTYLVGRSYPVPGAAIFEARGERAVSWRREAGVSSPDDLINVGLYVFDQEEAVSRLLEEVNSYEGADITDALIDDGMLAVYSARNIIYNINNPEIYHQLVADNTLGRKLQA